MWKSISVALPVAVLLAASQPARAQTSGLEAEGKAVVARLVKRDFDGVRKQFAAPLQEKLSIAQLRSGWEGSVATAGAYRGVKAVRTRAQSGIETVTVVVGFEKRSLDTIVSFGKDRRIVGLLLTPHTEVQARSPHAAAARAVLTELARGDFAAVSKRFDATMAEKLPAAALADAWKSVIAQAGAFEATESVRSEVGGGYDTLTLVTRFARARLDTRISFDAKGKIAGLFFAPHTDATP
jgi:hypothetical protein